MRRSALSVVLCLSWWGVPHCSPAAPCSATASCDDIGIFFSCPSPDYSLASQHYACRIWASPNFGGPEVGVLHVVEDVWSDLVISRLEERVARLQGPPCFDAKYCILFENNRTVDARDLCWVDTSIFATFPAAGWIHIVTPQTEIDFTVTRTNDVNASFNYQALSWNPHPSDNPPNTPSYPQPMYVSIPNEFTGKTGIWRIKTPIAVHPGSADWTLYTTVDDIVNHMEWRYDGEMLVMSGATTGKCYAYVPDYSPVAQRFNPGLYTIGTIPAPGRPTDIVFGHYLGPKKDRIIIATDRGALVEFDAGVVPVGGFLTGLPMATACSCGTTTTMPIQGLCVQGNFNLLMCMKWDQAVCSQIEQVLDPPDKVAGSRVGFLAPGGSPFANIHCSLAAYENAKLITPKGFAKSIGIRLDHVYDAASGGRKADARRLLQAGLIEPLQHGTWRSHFANAATQAKFLSLMRGLASLMAVPEPSR